MFELSKAKTIRDVRDVVFRSMVPGYTEMIARNADHSRTCQRDGLRPADSTDYKLRSDTTRNYLPTVNSPCFNGARTSRPHSVARRRLSGLAGTLSLNVLEDMQDEEVSNTPQFGTPFSDVPYEMPGQKEVDAINRAKLIGSIPSMVPVNLYTNAPYRMTLHGETAPNVDFGAVPPEPRSRGVDGLSETTVHANGVTAWDVRECFREVGRDKPELRQSRRF